MAFFVSSGTRSPRSKPAALFFFISLLFTYLCIFYFIGVWRRTQEYFSYTTAARNLVGGNPSTIRKLCPDLATHVRRGSQDELDLHSKQPDE